MGSFKPLDFYEPEDVRDVFINGIANVEPLGGTMIRVWLYADENLAGTVKVIRARLIMDLDRALELNGEVRGAFTALYKQTNPLRVVN